MASSLCWAGPQTLALDGIREPSGLRHWASMVAPCSGVNLLVPFTKWPSVPTKCNFESGVRVRVGEHTGWEFRCPENNAHVVMERPLKCSCASCDRGWSVLCNYRITQRCPDLLAPGRSASLHLPGGDVKWTGLSQAQPCSLVSSCSMHAVSRLLRHALSSVAL